MPNKREQLKAKLMVEVEALIENALRPGEVELTLERIEALARSAREQMSQALTGSLVEQQAEVLPLVLPSCPDCGQPIRPQGKKRPYTRAAGNCT
jgi:hypothetical protein